MSSQSFTRFQKDNQVKGIDSASNTPIGIEQEELKIGVRTASEIRGHQMDQGMEYEDEESFSDEDFSDMEETEDADEGIVEIRIRFTFEPRSG